MVVVVVVVVNRTMNVTLYFSVLMGNIVFENRHRFHCLFSDTFSATQVIQR
jgi:hypothetical protein